MVELPGTYVQGTLQNTSRTAPTAHVICGDVIDVLDSMPTGSVHSIITSPPYYGLRRYLPDTVKLRANLSGDERAYIERELSVLGIEPVL